MRAALAAAVSAAALMLLPAAAGAETLPVTCATLQSTITSVGSGAGHGAGDVIVLNGLCTEASLGFKTVTLPPESAFTLEGAPGTTSGIEGAGITSPILLGTGLGTIAIVGLTFENATSAEPDSPVYLRAAQLTLSGDSFLNDTHHPGVTGGALTAVVEAGGGPCGGTPAVSITGSTFRNDTDEIGGGVSAGGAAFVLDNCKGATNFIAGNVFEGNALLANGTVQSLGGALNLGSSSSEPGPTPVLQLGNVFAGNGVVYGAGSGNYGGAGEWLEGLSLTSVGDRFSGNALPGNKGLNWSWGAGLGVLSCNNTEATETVLENAIVAGNLIAAGEPSDAGGAGIYVGCGKKYTTPNHLALLDSTVTENAVASGGVAGVDGGPNDQLQVVNSIVAADVGGIETSGFSGPEGSLTSAYSDLCGPGAAPLQPGEGNICADPKLADDGEPASFDVHETPTSPTIDAGLNALVPPGLTTDVFGSPRIQPVRSFLPPCTPGATIGMAFYPATVDMGASEFGPVGLPAIAIHCPLSPPRLSSLTLPSIAQGTSGLLTLSLHGLAAGRLSVLGTFKLKRTVTRRVHGHRRHVKVTETITYCHAAVTTSSPGNLKLALTPNKRALSILRSHHRLKVTLVLTFTQPGDLPATQTETITVVYRAPKHKRHH
jgi:hypothetical protein